MLLALVLLACTAAEGTAPADAGAGDAGAGDADRDADTGGADTGGADTGGVTGEVAGTLGGEPYAFTCRGDAVGQAYASFPEGATWRATVSCASEDRMDGFDVVAIDAETGRTYTAADAASFTAFRVIAGGGIYDYVDPSSYALTFTTLDVEPDVGVTLAGTFSGTWRGAALAGTFAAYAAVSAR